jgi:hypothetical protein
VLLCDCIGYNLTVTFRSTKEILFREASNADIYNEDFLVKLNNGSNIHDDDYDDDDEPNLALGRRSLSL